MSHQFTQQSWARFDQMARCPEHRTTAQEEEESFRLLRKGASVTISLRLLGVLNITGGNCTGGRGSLCWERGPV